MATSVQRSGLGFDRFFRRRSSSPESKKDSGRNAKDDNEDDEAANESSPSTIGKLFGQKSSDDKNDPSDDPRSGPTKAIDDVASQRTDGSKKSSKKKKPAMKQDDKREEAEACKELVIKDDVGQVKLTEIINNSIKEAVLNIVKEGVCPLADSLERTKDVDKKATPCSLRQEAHDKENKPGSPKNRASLVSGANKTFDSHLCQSQYQPSGSSRSPYKTTGHEQLTANRCTRETCPHVGNDRKAKSPKQKDKTLREGSPKISRLAKGSSHFRTDNRRMTGSVNIYICSEANENAKDKKHKKDKNQCNDDSETTSETKTCTSSLSVSTSKLVAALRKKQRKNIEDQPSNCLCDIPESSTKQLRSASKIGDDVDNVSCLCDQTSCDAAFLDTGSSSSRDAVCDDTKFSDSDFAAGTDLRSERVCTSQECSALSESASDCFASYDNNDFWRCTSDDCPSYEDEYSEKTSKRRQSGDANDLDERCSCCNSKRCRKDRASTSPCHQEPRGRICRTQVNRCPCIVEEEDEDCCIDRKEPVEISSVCGNVDLKKDSLEKMASESGSGILKGKKQPGSSKSGRTLQIASASSEKMMNKKDEPSVEDADAEPNRPETPKKGLFSTFKKNRTKSADRESKTVSGETPKSTAETERVTEVAEASKEDNGNATPVTDDKRNNSFFYRSIKRAMGMVSTRKNEATPAAEENKDTDLTTPELLTEVKSGGKEAAGGAGKGADCPSGCVIEKGRTTSGITASLEKHSRSRISTAIAFRRNSAATSNSSNVSIPPCQTDPSTSGSRPNFVACQGNQKSVNPKQTPTNCSCQKVSDNCECCCKQSEVPKEKTCKCCKHAKCRKASSCTSVCCRTIETPKTFPCCPTCGDPIDCCVCCGRMKEIIEDDPCNCCPRCRRPMAECKCRCVEPEVAAEEFCDCCRRSKRLCCCEESSRGKRSRPKKCRQPSDFKDGHRCSRRFPDRDERCPKSMICIYCDNPQEDCTCRAPVRKCSQCGLPLDVCNCKPPTCCDCSGRLIVPTEGGNEQTICVTAWKPRRSVRRYFAREADDEDLEEDCPCYDKSKPYGSDGLPYQKRGVFSTVMTELQQKISGSVCCNVCGKVPCCCCCVKNERGPEERAQRPRLSTIAERRIVPCPAKERSRSKSPAESCACTPIPQRKRGKKLPSRFCDRCRTSPCRCRRRSSTAPQRKPQARCYYCKDSPCT